jgi:hypothetical protein
MAPKGTPDDVIQRLNAAIHQAPGEEAFTTHHDAGRDARLHQGGAPDFDAIAKAGKISVE